MEMGVIGAVISKFYCTHRGEKMLWSSRTMGTKPLPWVNRRMLGKLCFSYDHTVGRGENTRLMSQCWSPWPVSLPVRWDASFFFFFWTFWLIRKSENIGPQSPNVPAIIRYSHLFSKRKGHRHTWRQWEGKTRAKCLVRSYSLRGNKGPRWFWAAKYRTFRLWSPWHSTLNFFFSLR